MRVSAPKFFGIAYAVLLAAFFLSPSFMDGSEPLDYGLTLLTDCGRGGLGPLTLAVLFSRRLKRPFGLVDALRYIGVTLIGCSGGVAAGAASHYGRFRPWSEVSAFCTPLAIFIAGLLLIIVPSLVLVAPRVSRSGLCKSCGYDLTGNTSGTCPECGERSGGPEGKR